MNQDPERIHDAYAPVHILPRPQGATRGGAEDLDHLAAALPPGSGEPGAPYPADAPPNAPAVQPGQGRTPTTATPNTAAAATGGSPADTPHVARNPARQISPICAAPGPGIDD